MTRESLAVEIRRRIEEVGVAFIPAEDVWAAFTTGSNNTLAVDDALTAFAESNGWKVSTNESARRPAFIFREHEERR